MNHQTQLSLFGETHMSYNFFANQVREASDAREALEAIIDKHGLPIVCDMLGGICYDKGEHIRHNWQDYVLANIWEQCGKEFHKLEVIVRKYRKPLGF